MTIEESCRRLGIEFDQRSYLAGEVDAVGAVIQYMRDFLHLNDLAILAILGIDDAGFLATRKADPPAVSELLYRIGCHDESYELVFELLAKGYPLDFVSTCIGIDSFTLNEQVHHELHWYEKGFEEGRRQAIHSLRAKGLEDDEIASRLGMSLSDLGALAAGKESDFPILHLASIDEFIAHRRTHTISQILAEYTEPRAAHN